MHWAQGQTHLDCQLISNFISIIICINLTSMLISQSPYCLGQSLCGELEIHKQQKWVIGPTNNGGVRSLGTAQPSANLQQCLQQCCARPDCSAISFTGFLPLSDAGDGTSSGTTSSSANSSVNCALFECHTGDECPLADTTDQTDQEGLLSVRLRRTDAREEPTFLLTTQSPANNTSSAEENEEASDQQSSENRGDQRHILSLGNDGTSAEHGTDRATAEQQKQQKMASEEEEEASAATTPKTTAAATTTARKKPKSLLNFGTWDERFPLRAETTPVWAIGLAIVITVICLGLIVSLFCAFLCYRRHKLRMRTLEFTGPKKMPTLHAFNPS